ncbi:MAG: iron-containing alcohol dehydrogenase family protein [Muricomes sp.]
MEWKYTQPVPIYFGNGQLESLHERINERKYKKGLLVAGTHFVGSREAKLLMENKKNHLGDIFSGFSENPEVEEVDVCARILLRGKFDFVVAVGGGSVIDGAKAAAVLVFSEVPAEEYHGTGKMLPQKRLPVIAVPTTAGTGSEVTNVAVLSNREKGLKAPLVSDNFYPVCAVVDPELTITMPPYLTACTGIDVLSHAVEGYWSRGHQPICDALAVHSIKQVFRYLQRACRDSKDMEAREGMCEASVIAGMAFGLPKTTSSHACSFPLTNLYHIPHGEACGLTLDFFIRLNGKADKRTQELARTLGFKNSDEMADKVYELKRNIGLRTDLKDMKLGRESIEGLISFSHHPNLLNNPVKVTDEVLLSLYEGLC